MKTKKIIILFLSVFIVITLIGCKDKRTVIDKFNVLFYSNTGSTQVQSSKVERIDGLSSGDLITKPADPVAPGATFLGWYKDRAFTEEWDFANDRVTKSITLYSKWEITVFNIEYRFDEAGGEFMNDPVYEFTVLKQQILPKVARNGSIFVGWIDTPIDEYKVGNKLYSTTLGVTKDLIVYALFTNNNYTVTFRGLMPGVSNPKIHSFEYSKDILFPILEDTATMRFVGWFSLNGTETGDWGFQYINEEPFLGKAIWNSETNEFDFVPQSITVYGKWEAK